MKKEILALVLICLFAFPLIAEEEVIFKSILKDADFYPEVGKALGTFISGGGCWTLKFENGAVIRIHRDAKKSKPAADIWWIGKEYTVTKKGKHFQVKLVEETQSKKEVNHGNL